jgi:type I restriction enzyme M protein
MNLFAHDIVAKLWNLCNVLKDDGVSYHQYVIELTYLLFLKMAEETDRQKQLLEGYRWSDLKAKSKEDGLEFYENLLTVLGTKSTGIVKEIFAHARSSIKKSSTLSVLVEGIDKLAWYSVGREGL